MRPRCRLYASVGALLPLYAAGCSSGSSAPSDAPAIVDSSDDSTATVEPPGSPRVAVLAADQQRQVPTLLRVTNRQPALRSVTAPAAARSHLARQAARYRTTEQDLDQASVRFINDRGRGPILVAMRQYRDGLEVLGSDVKVLMRRNLDLVAIGGSPRAVGRVVGSFEKDPRDALVAALEHQRQAELSAADWVARGEDAGGYLRFDLQPGSAVSSGGLRLLEPARVKAAYLPHGEVLAPAYVVEILSSQQGEFGHLAHRYVLSGEDGAVLDDLNLQSSAHSYRVWADSTGTLTPSDGPTEDFTPHPTGTPDGRLPSFTASALITVEGLNTNPQGNPDPWLAAGATNTTGNNVDAYADQNDPDGYSSGDVRANVTSTGVFDHVYDTAAGPMSSSSQVMGAVTQLFYTTNWLHDWYYDSGFDEAAGNAQLDNYGRGGVGGDPLLAEAQDGALPPNSSRDNANMTTPADGSSPRMQMFLWTAPQRSVVELNPGGAVAATGAEFGPQQFDVTGSVTLADDGVAPSSDACEAVAGNVAGRIALVRRGTCDFTAKVQNAQNAGAIGVIIANNEAGAPPLMGGTSATITIPTVSIAMGTGDELQASVAAGAVEARLQRTNTVERAGSLDSGIVAHEWGHYLHLRLAPCSTDMCGAMSEGWGDFIALHMMVRADDDLSGAFPMGTYAGEASNPDAYFGLRRGPYSRNFDINALTFRHVSDGEALPTEAPLVPNGTENSEVHNAGEIWAAILFHAYGALVEAARESGSGRSFEQVRRLMSDYVVLGLQLAPPEPTFLEMRDALLTAAAANDVGDSIILARAFAERGAGTCAVSPPRDSTNFNGVVESYDLNPRIELGPIGLRDAAGCGSDEDGVLDRGEQGWVTVELTNAGPAEATAVSVDVTSALSVLSFPEGTSVQVEPIPAFETRTAQVPVVMQDTAAGIQTLALDVSVTALQACETTLLGSDTLRANTDESEASSATDDVESEESLWTPEGSDADRIWTRDTLDASDFFWHGIDYPAQSDTALVSPPLPVSATTPFVVVFSHRHQFEQSDGEDWDAAVVELSRDDGANWEDVSTYANPGYSGTVTTLSGNVLGGRAAYAGTNSQWPDYEQVQLDFGTSLAGETVRLRFRIGTDEAMSDHGWELDDIGFSGIDSTPFHQVVEDAGDLCVGGGTGGTGGATGGAPASGGVGATLPGTGGSVTLGGSSGNPELSGGSGGVGAGGPGNAGGSGGLPTGGSSPFAGGTGASTAQQLGGSGTGATGSGTGASPAVIGDAGLGGTGGAGANAGSSSKDRGCGCSTPGRRGSRHGVALTLLAALLLPARRRRRLPAGLR
jgi:MYXO-CTERM domain-containing protein